MINKDPSSKYDKKKLRLDLIPVSTFKSLSAVLTYGADQYTDRNWEKGLSWSRVYAAALRHLLSFWGGEDIDPESSLHHLDHAMCNIAFLREYIETRPGLDNRPRKSEAFNEKVDKALDKTRKVEALDNVERY